MGMYSTNTNGRKGKRERARVKKLIKRRSTMISVSCAGTFRVKAGLAKWRKVCHVLSDGIDAVREGERVEPLILKSRCVRRTA